MRLAHTLTYAVYFLVGRRAPPPPCGRQLSPPCARPMSMAFDSDFKQWPTLDAFAAHVATIPCPDWCEGFTVHNSYIPNEAQWRGMASMASMRKTYVGKGWSSGPHLYLAPECLRAADKGIFQMTPLAHQGTHAGACNAHLLGIETIANWDAHPPTPVQYDYLLSVLVILARAWGKTTLRVHNECMPGRTCPGRYLNANQLRADFQRRLAAPPPPPPITKYLYPGLPVYRDAARQSLLLHLPEGATVEIDAIDAAPDYAPGTGHVKRATFDGRELTDPGFVEMARLWKIGK